MYQINTLQQDLLIDSFYYLGPKRKEILETGWPLLFRSSLLEKIPVEEIKQCFHDQIGRPTKELRTMLGALLLQQMFDLTDEETLFQFCFNIGWQYALGLVSEEDGTKYLCERTLRTYRTLVMERGIDQLLFRSLTDTLLDQLNISTRKQRLDSTHIRSEMRRLSRLELLRKTIAKFLTGMRREHIRLLTKKVEKELVERYLGEKNGYFSQVKPSEAQGALQQAAEDLFVLVETFRTHPKIKKMGVFGLLQRVWNEQCNLTGGGDEAKVEMKDPKDVSSDCLQNPSDPDAGYSGHKGEGYHAQIMETYQDPKPEGNNVQPDLITYIDVEAANVSDTPRLPRPKNGDALRRNCWPTVCMEAMTMCRERRTKALS